VNEDLLGETYADSLLSLSMSIPVNWSDITEDIRAMVEMMFEDTENEYEQGLIFRAGYGNLDEVAFMLLFDFEFKRIDFDKERAIQTFLSDYTEATEVLKKGTYTHNQIRFHQMTSRDSDMINIKLVGYSTGDKVFILDYFVPQSIYMDYIETIESSIGSILIQ
jgi:hypothetical protein